MSTWPGKRKSRCNFISTHDEIKLDFDPEKLEKIFYNLLSNAFKFTPEGGEISVQLAVSSDRSSAKKLVTDHCLLITVKDTGIGIAPESLPHLFDRFYQADTSTSSVRNYEGTGIGLALAKELVELHLGDEAFGVEELAQAVNMSSSQVNRKLHALIDQPASQLIRSMRLERAADLLKQNAGNVAEIAYQVGFSDQAHFARSFKKQFGCAPSEFRRKEEK